MLLGSLGKVWAVSRRARNVYQTISIVAYFKLMNDIEKNSYSPTVLPTIEPIKPKHAFEKTKVVYKKVGRKRYKIILNKP